MSQRNHSSTLPLLTKIFPTEKKADGVEEDGVDLEEEKEGDGVDLTTAGQIKMAGAQTKKSGLQRHYPH